MKKKKLMGILNATPDSFYDGGQYFDPGLAIERGLQIVNEGADILDIGGESSRPNASFVSEQEELARVLPLIRALHGRIPISIDTMKPRVAAAAIEAGATMINDVSGFRHPDMRRLAAEAKVDICIMHMLETPSTMQKNPHYPMGIMPHLIEYFRQQVDLLLSDGIDPSRIILDPGIGFGKTVADNFQIIQNVPILRELGYPVLVGLSRKSFLTKILDKPASELFAGTIAMNTIVVLAGADMIRVHDVSAHRDMINLINHYQTC